MLIVLDQAEQLFGQRAPLGEFCLHLVIRLQAHNGLETLPYIADLFAQS